MCLAILIPGAAVTTPLYCYCSRCFCVEYRIQWRALDDGQERKNCASLESSVWPFLCTVYVTPTSFPGDNYIIIIYHTCGHKETTFNYTNELVCSLAEAIVGKRSWNRRGRTINNTGWFFLLFHFIRLTNLVTMKWNCYREKFKENPFCIFN